MKVDREATTRPLAKFASACAQLSQMAYALGPDARMPTFANLCVQTRVSKATLDAALGQLEAQGIVLRRQGAGIFVSSQLKRSIALVCDPQFSINPRVRGFWELIVREAQRRVAGSHYNLAFHFSAMTEEAASEEAATANATRGLTGDSAPAKDLAENDVAAQHPASKHPAAGDEVLGEPPLHSGLIDDIRAGRVQGVLTVGLPLPAVEWISAQSVAVVAFAGAGPVSVNLDDCGLIGSGVEALAARGCRRLAMWSAHREDKSGKSAQSRAQTRAFRRGLAARELEFQARWVRPGTRERSGCSDYDRTCDWVRETFDGPRENWPDGLLLTNDILARDVMAALQKLAIVPDRDVVIASHANSDSPVLRACEGQLTRIEFNSGEIVQAMFDLLETLLRGDLVKHCHVEIKPKIRVAKSVEA